MMRKVVGGTSLQMHDKRDTKRTLDCHDWACIYQYHGKKHEARMKHETYIGNMGIGRSLDTITTDTIGEEEGEEEEEA